MKSKAVINRYIKQHLLLRKEESIQETYEEIKEGALLKGHNFWIMFFAMIIACVGLTTNNNTALIGAMLISPLMGPIIGFSFGLTINDHHLKKYSFRNWLSMTLISLIASTLFFLISPFYHYNNAIDSFTSANLFDIMLAFFGGLAGFIGIIKKEGTKVIAGVAVATSCMPPLCTTGFGIANGNWEVALGGFYYYLINCLFIGLATFILGRFSKFHLAFNNNGTMKKTANWLWTIFIVAMIVPSLYLIYKKYNEEYNVPPSINNNNERIIQLEEKVKKLEQLLQK
jgi:uncharacterized hydrophobic protein (TIGR00271 family)